MVGKADIEMGLEDQMHTLFSHSIPYIGDDIRNSAGATKARRNVTVSTSTIAPAANASPTVLEQIDEIDTDFLTIDPERYVPILSARNRITT